MGLGLGIAAGSDAEALAHLAGEAESLGYRAIFSNDNPAGDGLAQLGAWAHNSSNIDLGVGVLALDRYTPEGIAARIDQLALPRDRLLLGLGAGFTTRPLAAIRDGVAAIRSLLPEVRILVAAMGPKMCSLAGEVADGTLLNWMTPERAKWARELVHDGAKTSGHDPASVMVYGYVRTAVGADATDRLAMESTMYQLMPQYARNFDAAGTPPGDIGIAVDDAAEVPARLAAYSALDIAVVRVLSERTAHAIMAVARAAIMAQID